MSTPEALPDGVQAQLADRYGRRSPARRKVLLGAVALVVLAFGGWLAWTTYEQANPPVASGNLRFTIDDDRTVSAAFEVDLRDADVEPTCTLVAYAEDHSTVGELSFVPEIGAGGRVEQSLRTVTRATSVELVGCTAPGQPRPR